MLLIRRKLLMRVHSGRNPRTICRASTTTPPASEAIERVTNHDVKAVRIFPEREQLEAPRWREDAREWFTSPPQKTSTIFARMPLMLQGGMDV